MNFRHLLAAAAFVAAPAAFAQSAPQVTLVNMGGNDCPPCRAWRATELPKLQSHPAFSGVRYVYISKSIGSTVPPKFFFPDDAKDLHEVLVEASGGRSGSPQQALLVNGKVVDYWWGTEKGSAEELVKAITALKAGQPMPRPSCLKVDGADRYGNKCLVPG